MDSRRGFVVLGTPDGTGQLADACCLTSHKRQRQTAQVFALALAQKHRSGFTLIELVVVVLIIGIIAAVAAPRMFDTAGDARDSAALECLAVIRDVIHLYKAKNGEYPGQGGNSAGFKSDLQPYFRGAFPKCPVGNQNDDVRVVAVGTPLSVTGSQGWAYSNVSGQFIINHADHSSL